MVMKVLGAGIVLFGLVISVFAGMAYFELRNAATSDTAPSADSMPLTRIVGPELFDSGNAARKPAALARTTFNRIYTIGGGGIVFAILGLLMLAIPHLRGSTHDPSGL